MGGLIALVALRKQRRIRFGFLRHADAVSQPRCIVLGHQPIERHVFVEVRVAEIVGAVGVGAAHRFGEKMQVQRRVVTNLGKLKAFEDVQHLNQYDTARARWRHADDVVAAVGARDRFAFDGLVHGEEYCF